ncbi:MAG: hypothetical protein Q4B82_01140 [Alysiella sp.]|uniref:hypothetical protein n=1 Tax=Alysiella sp. TaxID=1872483 RepID=UPI0026DD7367|nr:hypothetical protein [Alysiella sp.]MDO4433173.1 hypothetical protein [Alysiella sp.]
MKTNPLVSIALLACLFSGSLNAYAQDDEAPKRQPRNPEEQRAVRIAKTATGGGQVVSTDRDWNNWDVDILRGCLLFEVEVDHETNQVVSRTHDDSACHDRAKLIELREKARRYLLR